jgi:hypothetical protein
MLLGLDVEGSVRAGARALRLTVPQHLTADEPQQTIGVVRALRDAASFGLPVQWMGRLGDGIDARSLVHLAPPATMDGDPRAADLEEWRRRHRPGLCHFRIGPGFASIKDVRRSGASARFLLDGVTSELLALQAVVDVRTVAIPTRDLLDDLRAEDLVLQLGDYATLLPNRIVSWPVPALEI